MAGFLRRRAVRPASTAAAAVPETKAARGSHWIVLLVSAALEAVWALALHEAHGFSVLAPSLVFLVAFPLSMAGLGYAMRGIAISVAYAVWTGLGAAITVSAAMLLGSEAPSVLKLLFLAGIIGCVIGLKFVGDGGRPADPGGDPGDPAAPRPIG
ncbi:multidrug efflux SMR transporter [Leucobacter allii]|uniref:Multidrug efflux SMR transporter n=1 Tax=Leucobacter allii TaxID=2932247 RepID=A0ABY4FIU8_9MICO|nr:multidrug efflux SMR transporter [Leucobacter allii]UOQ55847.1 multidrug efflux SMR transporter [Leucobacter allii]